MNTTTNLQLKKPASTDHALVTDLNDNAQKIDDVVGAVSSLGSNTNLVAEILKRAEKVTVVNNGDLAALDANGNLTDSGKKASDFILRVSSPTNNNFAALDANGNVKDSGHKHSDYLTSHQDISGKADKVSGATSDNFAALDANGNLKDSGHKHSDYLTQHQDITGKADKVSEATNGDFAALDTNGNLTDSGTKPSDFILASTIATTTETQAIINEYVEVSA